MTLDEAISHEERNVEINKLIGEVSDCEPTNAIDYHRQLVEWLKELKQLREQEPKIGHCKDCKWWKDSDGAYRRGVGAESQCPINRKEVYEGNGYCFLFEPQESEVQECPQ